MIFKKSKKDKIKKEASKILSEISKNIKEKNYYRAALLYQILARHFYSINDLEKAVQYSLESAKYSIMIKKYFSAGWAYKNAAIFSKERKNYDKSIQYALEAAKYFSKINSHYGEQWSYNIAADSYKLKKDFISAIKYYKKSLEIEYDEHTEKRLENIIEMIPHPTVIQTSMQENVKEGEEAKFQITIKNETNDFLREISIQDKSGKEIYHIDYLKPGGMKIFIYNTIAKGIGEMGSPFNKITWKIGEESFEKSIKTCSVNVIPNIQMDVYVKNKPQIGKQSYIVFIVKNNSERPIKNVKIYVDFPIHIKAKSITPRDIEKIDAKDEKNFVFKILPLMTGENQIKWKINFDDIIGTTYTEESTFVLEEIEEIPMDVSIKTDIKRPISEEGLQKLRLINEEKRNIHSFLNKKPMTELEYVSLVKKMFYAQKAYILKDISLSTVCEHITQECECMSIVKIYNFKNESLLLFSGESNDKRLFLLTVAVKKEDDMIYVIFRLYSDKKDNLEELLTKIVDVIKYTTIFMSFAKEIEKVEIKKIINIIDSIVQRSKIGYGENNKDIIIKNSIVQRAEK